jgi:hypothetical protein
MASMNPAVMGNPNRMAILMSISEITPQLYISGLFFFIKHQLILLLISQVKWLLHMNKYKNAV